MKKIFTLVLMTMLVSLSAMADTVLGDPTFSIKDGARISPSKIIDGEGIIISFPNATELDAFTVSGKIEAEGAEPIEFDGLEGTFVAGCAITGLDGIEEKTNYKLSITSVKVGDTEMLQDTTYVLNFITRSAERKMSWTFTIDEDSHAKVKENADGDADLWSYVSAGTDQRFYACKHTNEPLMLDANTEMPMTENLTFTFGASKFYVGSTTDTKYQKLIAFNANGLGMTIPDCKKGDVITFNANRATRASTSKFTCIVAQDGAAIAADGYVSASGVQDSIQLGSSYQNFKFEVQNDGDIAFTFSNCLLASVNIEEAQEQVECTYSVNAVYQPEEGDAVVLKQLVAPTKSMTGTTIKVPYSYWLKSEDNKLYTHGTKGSEFTEVLDLRGDTTFNIVYKDANQDNVLYLSEGEDIEDAALCTHANAEIRSSNHKAGYVEKDTKLITLEPGSYKVSAILFDANKSASYNAIIKYGTDSVYLAATATNWTEVESQLITLTETTDIILKAGGSETQGIDIIAIYNSSDAPDPEVYFTTKSIEINGDSVANVLSVEGGWDDGSISYKSADTSIATVNAEGKVAGIAEGTTTITATYSYNGGKSKLTASYEVTVKAVTIDAAGISNITTETKKAVNKAVKNGKLYIETENGTYNAAGALIK